MGFELYDLFNAYITCPAGKKLMKRIGDAGDGGKWVGADELMISASAGARSHSHSHSRYARSLQVCIDILQEQNCVIFSLVGIDLDEPPHARTLSHSHSRARCDGRGATGNTTWRGTC